MITAFQIYSWTIYADLLLCQGSCLSAAPSSQPFINGALSLLHHCPAGQAIT